MKLWVLLILITAIVAVVSQSTAGKKDTTKSNKKTTVSGSKAPKTNKPKAKAGAAAPPPSGKKDNDNPQTMKTTENSQSRKITKPPAKAANNAYSKCMCQDDLGMDQFQLSKYLGVWYMVNMQPLMPMNPYTGNCMNVSYTATSKSNEVQVNTSSKFSISTIKSNDKMTYLGQGVFTWKLTTLTFNTKNVYPNGSVVNEVVNAPMNSTLKYVVIDTDYTNYTVAYICGNYSLGTSLEIKRNQTSKTSKYSSKDFTIPPNLFILMSRAKANTSSFDMASIKSKITQKYACYHNMNHPSAQDSGTCKA